MPECHGRWAALLKTNRGSAPRRNVALAPSAGGAGRSADPRRLRGSTAAPPDPTASEYELTETLPVCDSSDLVPLGSERDFMFFMSLLAFLCGIYSVIVRFIFTQYLISMGVAVPR